MPGNIFVSLMKFTRNRFTYGAAALIHDLSGAYPLVMPKARADSTRFETAAAAAAASLPDHCFARLTTWVLRVVWLPIETAQVKAEAGSFLPTAETSWVTAPSRAVPSGRVAIHWVAAAGSWRSQLFGDASGGRIEARPLGQVFKRSGCRIGLLAGPGGEHIAERFIAIAAG